MSLSTKLLICIFVGCGIGLLIVGTMAALADNSRQVPQAPMVSSEYRNGCHIFCVDHECTVWKKDLIMAKGVGWTEAYVIAQDKGDRHE